MEGPGLQSGALSHQPLSCSSGGLPQRAVRAGASRAQPTRRCASLASLTSPSRESRPVQVCPVIVNLVYLDRRVICKYRALLSKDSAADWTQIHSVTAGKTIGLSTAMSKRTSRWHVQQVRSPSN